MIDDKDKLNKILKDPKTYAALFFVVAYAATLSLTKPHIEDHKTPPSYNGVVSKAKSHNHKGKEDSKPVSVRQNPAP